MGIKCILIGFGIPARQIDDLAWWEDITLPTSNALNKEKYEEDLLGVEVPSPTFDFSSYDNDDPPSSPASTSYSGATLLGDLDTATSIKATCCPAQHNSGRGLLSHNSTLWASWYLSCLLPSGELYKVYFGG